MRIFGIEIRRARENEEEHNKPSFAPPVDDNGSLIVGAAGGSTAASYVDTESSTRNESELITRYRNMVENPEVKAAVEEITNEAFSIDAEDDVVKINLDSIEGLGRASKKALQDSFAEVVSLLNFNNNAYDLFRRWYVDGRICFHAIVDVKNPKLGIQEMRYVDPRKIRRVKEIKRVPVTLEGGQSSTAGGREVVVLQEIKNEYYLYNDKGFGKQDNRVVSSVEGSDRVIRVAKDSIVFVPSGLMDSSDSVVISYLHSAMKDLSSLRNLEDASIIYRLARAPERRVWYIDIGNLPKAKAEQYMQTIISRHRSKLVYDPTSGKIVDQRRFMNLLEDYFLPRRGESGKGTMVDTLPGGQNLGKMEDVEYFQKKLYAALNVPYSRLNDDGGMFASGRGQEITNAERKFSLFVARLRNKFARVFTETLKRQVILKGLMTLDEWERIESQIKYVFAFDTSFQEFRLNDLLQNRLSTLQQMIDAGAVGTYYSHKWVRSNVLKQTDEEQKDMDRENDSEADDPRYSGVGVPTGQAQEPDEDEESEEPEENPDQGVDVPFDDQEQDRTDQDVRSLATRTQRILSAKSDKTPADQRDLRTAASLVRKFSKN